MSEDTETVDEAEALIQQLLDAGMVERLQNSPQVEDETGENDETGDESEDEDGETDDETVDEGIVEEPVAAETPGPFDSLTSEEKAALLKVRALLTDNPDIAEKFDQAVKAKFS